MTVDWVVLTAAIIGLGFVVAGTVGEAVQGAAAEVTDELADAEPDSTPSFMTGAEFLASYIPLSPRHGAGSSDPGRAAAWTQSAYNRAGAMSDERLAQVYGRAYASAATGQNSARADWVAVQEQVMTERNIPVPSGKLTATQIRALYE